MIKNKFFNTLTIVLILMQAVLPINALAMTATDQPDYFPGSVVTINSDNSGEAGFLAGEVVQVDVTGPNGFAFACESTSDESAFWFCQVTIPEGADSVGSYDYTATGLTSGASQSGSFIVTAPPAPTADPTQEPTQEPTLEPTAVPTEDPTATPTSEPTSEPIAAPTEEPSVTPTSEPTVEPTSTALVTPTPAPFIRSDKDDYAPGELVTLTSGNWQPGESVHLIVNDVLGDSWRISVDVPADNNGSFIYQFNLPDWFVAQYHVYAYGAVSGVTTWDFTDARVVTTATLNGTSSVTVATGASITAVVTVQTDGTGANSRWRSTGWRISTTPPTPASFPSTITCVNHTNYDSAGTNSETFSITAPATAGTYTAYFVAFNDDACSSGSGGNAPSATFVMANAVVVKSNQTITFGALANKTFGDAAFNVSATASSGLAVAFSTTTPSVCTSGGTNGATVNLIGAGTCTVQADQAGNATFFPAVSVQQSFTVTQASSTTTVSCPASLIYTGASLTPCTVSVTGAGGLSLTPSATYTNNINVGTATASYSYAGDANHIGSSDSENFAITPASSTTTVTCPANVTYTGSPLTPCSATVTGVGGLNQTLTVNYSNNTDAGTANASASFAGDANHTGSNDSEIFGIDQAASVTVVTCPANVTYDGFAQTPCTANVTGAGGLNQPLTVNYSNNTDAGTANASASFAGDTNHTGSSDSETFVIDQAASITVVTCAAGPFIYDGSAFTPCTASVTGAGGLNESLTVSYTNNVNAGTATASASYAGDTNHTGSNDSETFVIDQAASVTVVTCAAGPFVYNGSAFTPCTASVTGAGGLNESLTVNYSNNTNAGIATANASFAGDANHTSSNDSETFTIDKATTTTTVTCAAGPFTYTGSTIEPCTASVTGDGGLNESLAVDYADNTDAGVATASASYAESANYLGSSDSETFTIDPAGSTTTVSCAVGPFTYNGSAHTPCSASYETADGLSGSLTVNYSNNTEAGEATASASYLGDTNHTGSNDSETFTIDKAATTTTVICAAGPFTYTGSPIEPCTASVTGAGGLNESLTVDYNDNIDAGEATASANYAESANYLGSNDSETFTIDKAATTTTVTCAAGPFTYMGSSIEPCTANVTGAGGLDESLTVDYTDNIDAGIATASASYAESANYLGSSDSETFTINPAGSTTTVTCPANVTYDGSAQTPCSASYETEDGLSGSLTVSYSDNTDAGEANASASYAGDANHTGSNDTETFTIDKAATTTTVICAAGPFTYTGSPIEPCTASVTGAGGLNESLTVSYSNNTDAGEATASANYAESANYLGSGDSETFTIDQAPSTTVVTCASGPFIYDGSAFTPCTASVTGAGGLSESLTVSYSNNIDAGEATASASFAGDANHTGSNDSETFTIDRAATTTIVTCAAGPFTHTGSPIEPCTASVTGAGGLDESLTVNYSNNTDAGVATASASYAESANYLGSSDSETFTIDPAGSTTTVTCAAGPFTYNGSVQTPCSASYETADGLSGSLTVNYSDNTNAGEATASASYAGDANHTGSNDTETFTIDQAPSTTVVTCAAGPFIYDGSAFTPCTAAVTGAGDLDESLTVSYTDNVNAGTATANASFAGDANHTSSSDTETFVIDQAASITVVSCAAGPFTYNGSAQTPCTASVTGAGGLNESLTVSYTDNVNAGTVTASASFVGDTNHTGSSDTETFVIDQAASVTVVTCAAGPFTYTGSVQEPCSVSVTGAGGLNLTPNPVYTDNINAGTATASYEYAGDLNHTGSNDSETFIIGQAASVTTVTCPTNVTYTGAALTPCSATATGAGGLNQSLTVNYSNNTNAGTANANASYAGDANHTGSSDTETFIINQASSLTTVTCTAGPFIYNGSAHTPCTAAVTGAGGLNQSLTANYINNVNAGTATANASYAGDANHTGSNDSENFTIAQASSTTTVTCPASVVFTGSPQTPCSAVVTGVGGLNQSLTVTYTNNTNVGTATASATYAGDANHTGSTDSETFAITPWSLRGFYQPVDMYGVLNIIKGGSTVPLKFEVFSGATELTNISAVRPITFIEVSCATMSTALLDEIETSATGGTSLRYDSTSGQFIYNWKTPNTVGKCYRVTMTTIDNSTLVAYFKTK